MLQNLGKYLKSIGVSHAVALFPLVMLDIAVLCVRSVWGLARLSLVHFCFRSPIYSFPWTALLASLSPDVAAGASTI